MPCNDVGLIWKAHRSHPASYAADFLFLTGSVPASTDVDVAVADKAGVSYTRTKQLWKDAFAEVIFKQKLS